MMGTDPHELFLRSHGAALCIQRWLRERKKRTMWLSVLKKGYRAAIMLQKLFRGHKVRKKYAKARAEARRPPRSTSIADVVSPTYRVRRGVGDRVEARRKGGLAWEPATIVSASKPTGGRLSCVLRPPFFRRRAPAAHAARPLARPAHRRYSVRFAADGTEEHLLTTNMVRPLTGAAELAVGGGVEGPPVLPGDSEGPARPQRSDSPRPMGAALPELRETTLHRHPSVELSSAYGVDRRTARQAIDRAGGDTAAAGKSIFQALLEGDRKATSELGSRGLTALERVAVPPEVDGDAEMLESMVRRARRRAAAAPRLLLAPRRHRRPPPPAQPPCPAPRHVLQGFDSAAAQLALHACNGDIVRAIDFLAGGGTQDQQRPDAALGVDTAAEAIGVEEEDDDGGGGGGGNGDVLSRTLVKKRSRRSAHGSRWSTPTQKHHVVKGFDADERADSPMAPGEPELGLTPHPDPMSQLVRLPSDRDDPAKETLPKVGGRGGLFGRMRKRWGAK